MVVNSISDSRCGLQVLDAAGAVVLNPDPLEKAAKIGHKTIDLTATFMILSEPFHLMAGHLKNGVAFFETVQFFGKFRELLCPDANGKSFFEVNTREKRIDKVSIAIHSAMKAVRALAGKGIVNLGKLAATVVGKLTVFSLITDAFFITGCCFTIADNYKQSVGIRKDLFTADVKIKKWKGRQALFSTMEASEQAKIVCKLKKWHVVESNAALARHKLLFASVHTAAMICVTSMAITLAATNCAAVFAVRSLLAAGIATDSLGIARFLFDYYNKPAM